MAEGDTEQRTASEGEAHAPTFPGWVLWAAGVVSLLLIAFAVVIVLTGQDLRSYTNNGGGMRPTIRVGEQITADLDERSPRLGDIIVFHPPENGVGPTPTCGASGTTPRPGTRMCSVVGATRSSQTFVKRVVGLPGDVLSLVDGQVLRNGLSNKAIACTVVKSYCSFPHPVTVSAGTYYVLGDNRSSSDDSRFWGPVRRRWIVGILVHCSLLDSFCSRAH